MGVAEGEVHYPCEMMEVRVWWNQWEYLENGYIVQGRGDEQDREAGHGGSGDSGCHDCGLSGAWLVTCHRNVTPGEKCIIANFHDECCFHVNDHKWSAW